MKENPLDIFAFDPEAYLRESRAATDSADIQALLDQIDIGCPETVLLFGAEPARRLSAASDTVLSAKAAVDVAPPLEELAALMTRIDPDELTGRPALLGRLFGAKQRNSEQIVEKYTRVGVQLDALWARLKGCEEELNRLNERLLGLFAENMTGLAELEKYIDAGEEALREMDEYLLASPGDPALPVVQKAREEMHSRLIALRTAETAALQAFPMLKMMIRRNLDLTRTIDSAFIAILPVFRQQLTAAVTARRQEIEAEAMRALLRREARAVPAADVPRAAALEASLKALRKGLDDMKQQLG